MIKLTTAQRFYRNKESNYVDGARQEVVTEKLYDNDPEVVYLNINQIGTMVRQEASPESHVGYIFKTASTFIRTNEERPEQYQVMETPEEILAMANLEKGLTSRQYIAAKVLAGFLSNSVIAKADFKMADAERAQTNHCEIALQFADRLLDLDAKHPQGKAW